MADNRFRDRFEQWQYRIFRWVLFILFLATVYKLLDSELHIGQIVSSFWK
jgi:hypothetical protein